MVPCYSPFSFFLFRSRLFLLPWFRMGSVQVQWICKWVNVWSIAPLVLVRLTGRVSTIAFWSSLFFLFSGEYLSIVISSIIHMAKSSAKKRASRASKATIGANSASDHMPIHDTLTSTPTILMSLQCKSEQSASMSDTTTPSPTSAGSSVASENGVNSSSSDADNASSGSSDGLNETNSGECANIPSLKSKCFKN